MRSSSCVTGVVYLPPPPLLYNSIRSKLGGFNGPVTAFLIHSLWPFFVIFMGLPNLAGSNASIRKILVFNCFVLFCSAQILTGNSDGGTVKDIPIDPIEAKYVKFTSVDKEGTHVCVRTELYTVGQ